MSHAVGTATLYFKKIHHSLNIYLCLHVMCTVKHDNEPVSSPDSQTNNCHNQTKWQKRVQKRLPTRKSGYLDLTRINQLKALK